jgi:hypothetical protein
MNLDGAQSDQRLVTVSDRAFVDRVDRSEIAFAKGDWLVCKAGGLKLPMPATRLSGRTTAASTMVSAPHAQPNTVGRSGISGVAAPLQP